jgi:hypothetical protein
MKNIKRLTPKIIDEIDIGTLQNIFLIEGVFVIEKVDLDDRVIGAIIRLGEKYLENAIAITARKGNMTIVWHYEEDLPHKVSGVDIYDGDHWTIDNLIITE